MLTQLAHRSIAWADRFLKSFLCTWKRTESGSICELISTRKSAALKNLGMIYFPVLGRSPEIARLLNQIDEDCKSHWLRIRAMLADADPLSAAPP